MRLVDSSVGEVVVRVAFDRRGVLRGLRVHGVTASSIKSFGGGGRKAFAAHAAQQFRLAWKST